MALTPYDRQARYLVPYGERESGNVPIDRGDVRGCSFDSNCVHLISFLFSPFFLESEKVESRYRALLFRGDEEVKKDEGKLDVVW
jgi:hypothetical protein